MAKTKIKSKNKKNKNRKNKISRRKSGKKWVGFTKPVRKIKNHVLEGKPKTVGDAIKIALKSAKSMSKKIKPSRIIQIPKTGGILPLISAIANTVNGARSAKQQLEEAKRHNGRMESISVDGKRLYLRPYKTGLALFLHPPQPKNY